VLRVVVLISGLLSWDESASYVDLAQELSRIVQSSPPGEEAKGGNFKEF
jgi:hypothetical protein